MKKTVVIAAIALSLLIGCKKEENVNTDTAAVDTGVQSTSTTATTATTMTDTSGTMTTQSSATTATTDTTSTTSTQKK